MFPVEKFPDLLVGLATEDDAAVYRLSERQAVILTVDFITPIVDDPTSFGRIAAANSLSDVYAMGGEPVLALNVAAFPKKMADSIMIDIMQGGAEKAIEAGAVIGGGHTINDEEPKYGLVVMGLVDPVNVIRKEIARPGDVVLLTKPLGTGAITTALKEGRARDSHLELATRWMCRLNASAASLVRGTAHAGTDVTGFSLLGHALEITNKSAVSFKLDLKRLPFLTGAADYAEQTVFPGGTYANQKAFQASVFFDDSIPEHLRLLLFTPETSGGLLLTVPESRSASIIDGFARAGEPCWQIGHVVAGSGIRLLDETGATGRLTEIDSYS